MILYVQQGGVPNQKIIVKTGTIYSKRRLTEYLFRDIGILFGGIFIGKSIEGLVVNYNICFL